jgi:primosomal protein N' (replication factor Y)
MILVFKSKALGLKAEYLKMEETEFVDVLLPVALPTLFTYRVQREWSGMLLPYTRVIVPFGKRKKVTGLVIRVHHEVPTEYAAKYVDELLDEQAVITHLQYKLWQWISEYYFCHIGEVMAAALPSGLKLSSETMLMINTDFDELETVSFTANEQTIIDWIKQSTRLSISDLERKSGISKVGRLVKKLLQMGVLVQEEEVKRKFKPLTESYVELVEDYQNEDTIHQLLDGMKRAPKQQNLLLSFLSISRFFSDAPQEVRKVELLQKSGSNLQALDALVKKGVFDVVVKHISRIKNSGIRPDYFPVLSEKQQIAKEEIKHGFAEKKPVLLLGITSSGKTEVYIHLMADALQNGKQVLYLLPEIALTTQIISRLKQIFGDKVLVYHSRFSENERVELWNRLLESNRTGESLIVLGARSSLFMPFENLGLIIVDEEHDSSYKQTDPAPRYNARDTALVMAQQFKCSILLGSATPALETYHKTKIGKYVLVKLLERYGNAPLPLIEINDLRIDKKKQRMKTIFAPLLINRMNEALGKEEQVILFQNRRGFAPMLECQACHWIPHCKQCDISLTYHKAINQLRCHYCGYMENVPHECGQCHNTDIKMKGFGTEKVEEDLAVYFPDSAIKRLDLDSTRSKYAFHKIIDDFENNRIQILVGTQMITKGLDFDKVSVVGILSADAMLNYPDFRAFERAFQLMSQVAGRAGRRNNEGKVIVQTYQPDHPVLEFVKNHSYEDFFNFEIEQREIHHYPPFFKMIYLIVKHEKQDKADQAAELLGLSARQLFGERVLGPEYPVVAKVRNQFQKRIMLKIENKSAYPAVRQALFKLIKHFNTLPESKNIRLVVDIDPF